MNKTGSPTVRYEARVTIDRPISDVFARLADLDGYGTWMHGTGLSAGAAKPPTVLSARGRRTSTPRDWAPSAVK